MMRVFAINQLLPVEHLCTLLLLPAARTSILGRLLYVLLACCLCVPFHMIGAPSCSYHSNNSPITS